MVSPVPTPTLPASTIPESAATAALSEEESTMGVESGETARSKIANGTSGRHVDQVLPVKNSNGSSGTVDDRDSVKVKTQGTKADDGAGVETTPREGPGVGETNINIKPAGEMPSDGSEEEGDEEAEGTDLDDDR